MSETAVLYLKFAIALYCISTVLMIISYSVRFVTEILVISTLSSLCTSIIFSLFFLMVSQIVGIYLAILWFLVTCMYWEVIKEDLRWTIDVDFLEAQHKQG